MNERIKELFNQAGGQGTIHPLKYNGTLNVEKFAELIVRELTERLVTDTTLEYNEAIWIANYLKNHFGVGE